MSSDHEYGLGSYVIKDKKGKFNSLSVFGFICIKCGYITFFIQIRIG